MRIEPGRSYGFFTDTTVCIGCKACEVACKEWNNLPADNVGLTGQSFDNTGALSANTWRHVAFVEKAGRGGVRDGLDQKFQSGWLMMSDVCKHCHNAPCLEACPTGALFKTEFDTVVVQQDICNGCGYCVPACPFGVVDVSPVDGKAHKCTLCYDRLKGGLEPACAKACPTNSIQFGELSDLQTRRPSGSSTCTASAWRAPTSTGPPTLPGHRRARASQRLLPAPRPAGDLQPAGRPDAAREPGGAESRHRSRHGGGPGAGERPALPPARGRSPVTATISPEAASATRMARRTRPGCPAGPRSRPRSRAGRTGPAGPGRPITAARSSRRRRSRIRWSGATSSSPACPARPR
ncbi:4Fe-4S dicluster domain-containing protein [Methylobacterium oryzae CBMB20]